MGGALVVTNMILLVLLFQVRRVSDVDGMHPISPIITFPATPSFPQPIWHDVKLVTRKIVVSVRGGEVEAEESHDGAEAVDEVTRGRNEGEGAR